MNILHTETLKRWGGQQNRVLVESLGLIERGHEVIIACNRGSMLAGKARDAGIRVYELEMEKRSLPANIMRLVRIIRKEGVEIVATHSSVDSWAGGIAARLTGRKLVRFKHNLNPVKKDPLTRIIYSQPHAFITVNQTAAEVLKNAGFIPAWKIRRIYGFIDSVRFDPGKIAGEDKAEARRSLGIPEDALVIGNTSGGFTSVKGQKYLAEAFSVLGQERGHLYLLLVGRSAAREPLLDCIPREFMKRVVLTGYRTDIPLLLSIMDIFVFPSILEAFGNSLIEAMAMGLPVVASDIPSFREFMTAQKDGIFFSRADSAGLTRALRKLIADPEKRRLLGTHAAETVRRRFPRQKMIEETERLYLDLLRGDGD